MKLQFLAAACAATFALAAGQAFAADAVTAKLQQPVAEKTKFIAGGAIFLCEGDQCVASNATSQTFATATCKAVAAKVGPLAAFTGRKDLEAERLADCNKTAVARAAGGAQLAKQ
jgi:hypothetical protein